jgi:hypothetical protein
MTPKPPPNPTPAPPPPNINEAQQQADANNLLRRRRGYAATTLTEPGNIPQTRTGTKSVLGNGSSTSAAY